VFGVGFSEIVLILVVALIIFGPKKLPEIARMLGKALGEFRKAASDFKNAIELEEIKSYKPANPTQETKSNPPQETKTIPAETQKSSVEETPVEKKETQIPSEQPLTDSPDKTQTKNDYIPPPASILQG
jgi:sec-independent protein translocase protein TatB